MESLKIVCPMCGKEIKFPTAKIVCPKCKGDLMFTVNKVSKVQESEQNG